MALYRFQQPAKLAKNVFRVLSEYSSLSLDKAGTSNQFTRYGKQLSSSRQFCSVDINEKCCVNLPWVPEVITFLAIPWETASSDSGTQRGHFISLLLLA